MKSENPRGHIVERKNEVPRLVIILFATAGLAAVITLVSLFAPDIFQQFIEEELTQQNRAWLTRDWTQAERSLQDIVNNTQILKDNHINGVYLQTTTWHGQTGELIELPYSAVFIEQFRQNIDIPIYAWITVDEERLADVESRRQIEEYARVSTLEGSLDGIHLQTRSVLNENDNLMTILRSLRDVMGPQYVLSITVPPDRTPSNPQIPTGPSTAEELTWSQEYKRRIALNVNEMVLMGHASGLADVNDYEQWLSYQVATYAEVIHQLEIPMVYIIALPTYEAELGHDPAVENVESAISGIIMGMRRAQEAGNQVDGVGLYPWEQTDLLELDAYWEQWVNR